MHPRIAHHLIAASALLLAGCGSSSLTTASLTGGNQPAQAAVDPAAPANAAAPAGPPPSDPTSRALQVGATSARAVRCGFYFDPAKLKASFLAAESAAGTSPDQLQRIEREYEFTRLSVAKKIAEEADYCSEVKTQEIKRDLSRHLAGDFTPPPKKEQPNQQGGFFADLMDGSSSSEKEQFKADTFFDKLGRTRKDR